METDFLNFRDEEHFGTGLYQSDLLDDSQSSLLDIVGGEYSRHNSVIWEQDIEQEINGDVAVIPMCGKIDTFPKLSNSPPTKDFHRIFSDWQHLAAIEVPPTEELTDLHLPHQHLDMLDCFNTTPISPNIEEQATSVIIKKENEPILESPLIFDQIESNLPKSDDVTSKIIKKPQISAGKNLELMKKVVKTELALEEIEQEHKHIDEFDNLDNFDITQYINPEADILHSNFLKQGPTDDIVSNDYSSLKVPKIEYKCELNYEDNVPIYKNDNSVFKNERPDQNVQEMGEKSQIETKKLLETSEEDDCIDVETVPEQIPVLEACDLTSLLEQFEASEAINPKSAKKTAKIKTKSTKFKSDTLKTRQNATKCDSKIQKNQSRKSNDCYLKSTISNKILQKLRATSTKKSIAVIPAMPSKKARNKSANHEIPTKQKALKIVNSGSIYFDHDYCCLWPANRKNSNCGKSGQKRDDFVSNIDAKIRKIKDLDLRKSRKVLDDTAIRIKNALNNEKLHLTQENLLKNQPVIKNADGKLMVSLLKTNNRLLNVSLTNKVTKTTIINTGNEEKIQIIHENIVKDNKNAKKRKLNLEEYKKLRGDVKFSQSTENSLNSSPIHSGANSPLVQPEKEKLIEENYQEIMNKMASEILKTNVKTKSKNLELSLEKFVPPELQITEKTEEHYTIIDTKSSDEPENINKINDSYEIITIVSIGTNTDLSYIKPEKFDPKSTKFDQKSTKFDPKSSKFDPKSSKNDPKSSKNDPKSSKSDAKLLKTDLKLQNDKTKLTEIIKPILQNASSKINSNSLITNITETLLQKSPNIELIQVNLIENSLKPVIEKTQNTQNINSCKSLSSKFENLGLKLAKSVTKNGKLIPKNDNSLLKTEYINKTKQTSLLKNENTLKSELILPKTNNIVTKNETNFIKIENESPKYENNLVKVENIVIKSEYLTKIDTLHKTDIVLSTKNSENFGNDAFEHGEDKTVIVLDKNCEKPMKIDVSTQTDDLIIEEKDPKMVSEQFRIRRTSSESSSTSNCSTIKIKKSSLSNRQSVRNSSSTSISSSFESTYSRSRSRSRSTSSISSQSSYLSDSSGSRSRSVSPTRYRNSRSRNRSYRSPRYRSTSYRNGFSKSRSSYSRSRSRRRLERENAEERMREVEERRVIYVGKISDNTTKADLRRRFQNFGPITNVSVHFRDHGDNYGFVTFAYKVDAYEAVEKGNEDPNLPKYDISFGGRRAFCKTQYSDLDNIEAEELTTTQIFRKEEDSFDILLREVQAKLLKRKV